MLGLLRSTRDLAKRVVARPLFELFQHVGLNVTPVHFYSEIPDLRQLRSTESWRRAYDLSAIRLRDLRGQLELLRTWAPAARRAKEHRVYQKAMESEGSGGYGPVEAHVLYGFVAHERPRRILQVGGGVSTSIMMQALERAGLAAGREVRILCVEPYPSEFLKRASNQRRIELVEERAQDWDPTIPMGQLGAGDLVFVDSTHTTVPGSDVNRIILEWLPILPPGVWVHFHDIYLPYDYPPGLLTRSLFFTRESVVLQAFLSCNSHFRVEVSLSLLHHQRQGDLQRLLGDMYSPRPMRQGLEQSQDGHFPSSTYFRSTDATEAILDL